MSGRIYTAPFLLEIALYVTVLYCDRLADEFVKLNHNSQIIVPTALLLLLRLQCAFDIILHATCIIDSRRTDCFRRIFGSR